MTPIPLDPARGEKVSKPSVESPIPPFTVSGREDHDGKPTDGDSKGARFEPVNRWKEKIRADQLVWLEALIGDYLQELGYEPESAQEQRRRTLSAIRMRFTYATSFKVKLWLKNHTFLGSVTDISRMDIQD